MTNASCTVDGLSTLDGFVDISSNSVHTIALADPSGANVWTLVCIATDDSNSSDVVNATVNINATNKTATFTSPIGLSSLIFESVVNGGVDINGRTLDSLRSRFKVCVPQSNLRLAVVGETLEHDTKFGWTPLFNGVTKAFLANGIGQNVAASISASYITLGTDVGLTSERVLTAGVGLKFLDGGAGSTLTVSANDSILATVSGTIFTKLSGSLQRTGAGLSYLVGGGGITVVSQSNGQIIISPPAAVASNVFTAVLDLAGDNTSQTVVGITGLTGTLDLRKTASTVQWGISTVAPTLNQLGTAVASATGAVLTVQAQNATGATSTGGNLILSTGTGTSIAGNLKLQTGGTDRVAISPTVITVNPVHTDVTGNAKCTLRSDVNNVQTTDATVTNLYSWTIATNAVTTIDITVSACTTSAGSISGGFIAKKSMSFRRNSGSTVVSIGSNVDGGSTADTALASISAIIDNSGTTGRVRVTGLSATTIQWGVNVAIQEIIQ